MIGVGLLIDESVPLFKELSAVMSANDNAAQPDEDDDDNNTNNNNTNTNTNTNESDVNDGGSVVDERDDAVGVDDAPAGDDVAARGAPSEWGRFVVAMGEAVFRIWTNCALLAKN